MPTTTPEEIRDVSWPPRFRWLKRSALGLLGLLIVLTIARLWWGHVAHQRLQRELDVITAEGDLISVDQIPAPHVPDGDNAALLWYKAIASVNGLVNTPAQSNLNYQNYPPWTGEWHHLLETGVSGNATALAIARQARGKSGVDWKITLVHPIYTVRLPSLNLPRNLANVIGDAALHAHLHGDDFEAIERVRDVYRLGKDVGDDQNSMPLFISHLVGIGIKGIAMARLQLILPDLEIVPTSATTRPAQREQLQNLLRELLADSEDPEPLRHTLALERLSMIDYGQFVMESAFLTRPMVELDLARQLHRMDVLKRAAEQPTMPAVRLFFAKAFPNDLSLFLRSKSPTAAPPSPRISRIAFARMGITDPYFVETDMRFRQETRFAAIALAVRLYRADHDKWPASLSELVPAYLPKLPTDLFSYNGGVIGYLVIKHGLPNGGDRPLIYSGNAIDNGQIDETYAPPVPQYQWSGTIVQMRDLAGWSPPASTQPTTDQSQ